MRRVTLALVESVGESRFEKGGYMGAGLVLQLLGPFEAALDGAPLAGFPTKAVQALLIYLTCQPEEHRREGLMAMLWPEILPNSARSNLRQNLYLLRQTIPETNSKTAEGKVPFLLADRHTVQVNPDAGYELDVHRFSRLLKGPPEAWPEAVELYRGDFLADFYLPDSAPYEEWVHARRADLRRELLGVLETLASNGLREGDLESAEKYARRQLSIDNLRESAHRQLMETVARQGQRSDALAQYEICRRLLEDELGVAPEAETQRLVEAIRSGAFDRVNGHPAATPSRAMTSLPAFLEEESRAAGAGRPVFVARQRQLARMDELLETALAGEGRVLFVTGGPGLGKTALMTEFGRRAQQSHPDLLVAWGSCNAFSGIGDPYLPFREAMGMLTGDVESQYAAGSISREHARRLWGSAPRVIEGILEYGPSLLNSIITGRVLLSRATTMAHGTPWLERLRKHVEQEKASAAGLEQSHLFQQLTNVLGAVASGGPLLLLLDDMQWSDNASISLLFHLGRRLAGKRILIACAYRPEEVAWGSGDERHPLEKVLSEFKRIFGDVWVDLARIEESEDREFVNALLETQPNRLGEEFRVALTLHTGGNALFAVELLQAMQERGDLIRDEEEWVEGPTLDWNRLPARVEATIAERMGRLEKEQREILSIASVEGEVFTAQVVAKVLGVGERKLLQSLSGELEQRHHLARELGEIEVGPRRLSQYRFSHGLFQQYLYESLSHGERRLLHGEVAASLEALYEGATEGIAVQLANHYSLTGEKQNAIKYLEMAGSSAEKAYAYQEAENHFRGALALNPSDLQRADLLSQLGTSLDGQRKIQESIQTWNEAIELYRTLGPEGLDGMALSYSAIALAALQESPPKALKICQTGLRAVDGAPDGPGLGLLLLQTARAFQFSGSSEEAWDFCRQAMAMARRLGDIHLEAEVLAIQGLLPGQPAQESMNALTRAVELAELVGENITALVALGNLSHRLPNLWARRDSLLRAAAMARQFGRSEVYYLGTLSIFALRKLGALGDVKAALDRIHQEMADPVEERWTSLILVRFAEADQLVRRGEWSQGIELLRECQADASRRGARQYLMYTSGELAFAIMESRTLGDGSADDECEEAEMALTEAVELSAYMHTSTENPTLCRCYLIRLLTIRDQFREAHGALAEARAARNAAGLQINRMTEAYLLSAEAYLEAAEGHYDAAMPIFAQAVETYEKLGMRWDHARILIDWADACQARNESGDKEQVQALLQQSLTMFQEMGTPGYVTVVEDRLEALDV